MHKIPVYNSDRTSINHYLIPFKNDCIICLSFHTNPKMLSCGHIFCSTCLDYLLECEKNCPECKVYIKEILPENHIETKNNTTEFTIINGKDKIGENHNNLIIKTQNNTTEFTIINGKDKIGENHNNLIIKTQNSTTEKEKINSLSFQTKNNTNKEENLNNLSFKMKTNELSNIEEIEEKDNNLSFQIKNNTNEEENLNNLFSKMKTNELINIEEIVENIENLSFQIQNNTNEKTEEKFGNLSFQTQNNKTEKENLNNLSNKTKNDISKIKTIKWLFYEDININDEILLRKGCFLENNWIRIENMNTNLLCNASYYIPDNLENDHTNFSHFHFTSLDSRNTNNKILCQNDATKKIIQKNLLLRENKNKLKNLFFQSIDGQLIFLKDKEIEKIKSKFGFYEEIPDYFLCRILRMEKIGDKFFIEICHELF